jgi:hypothetical protein
MINLKDLSIEEIHELERQIQEYKQNKKSLIGYKVTFCVLFNPEKHEEDSLSDIDSFDDWLVDAIPDLIKGSFNFNNPERVILDEIDEMTNDEVQELIG